jgi:DNA-binding response OmpR family regulator
MEDITSQTSTSSGLNYSDDADELVPGDETLTHIPKVLIIEDVVELGEVIQATIERMKVFVFRETHGLTGLNRYNEIHPDLVLLDIGLPDMTGWKVLDAIKESKAIFRRPAIIVMTAFGDPANRLMGKLQGVDDYLIKPFTPQEVERVVRQVLGMKPKGS